MLCAIFSHFRHILMFTQLQIQLSQHAFLDGIDGGRRTLKKSQKNERNSQKLVQYIGEVQLCLENILKKSLKSNLFQFPKRNSATQTFSPKCSRNSKKMRNIFFFNFFDFSACFLHFPACFLHCFSVILADFAIFGSVFTSYGIKKFSRRRGDKL